MIVAFIVLVLPSSCHDIKGFQVVVICHAIGARYTGCAAGTRPVTCGIVTLKAIPPTVVIIIITQLIDMLG